MEEFDISDMVSNIEDERDYILFILLKLNVVWERDMLISSSESHVLYVTQIT